MRLRGLEAGARSALVTLARQHKPLSPLDFGPGQPAVRVLYLRYDRIGDMILSTGLLRAIARSHPNVVVDVLASPENAPVLDGNPHVGSVIIADRRQPRSYVGAFGSIRQRRYDAILDCQVFSPSTTTLIMMLASRARHRIGLAGRGVDDALTLPVPRPSGARHYVEHLAALAAPFGADAQTSWRPELFLTAAEQAEAESRWGPRSGRRLLVNISAGKPTCRWPEDRWATILGALDMNIVLTAAPSDAAMAERLGGGRFVRTRSVREVFALVAAADYVLTPDTAITHVASAFNKPAVVLFPRNRAEIWGPYQTAGIAVSASTGSLESLPVEPVREALSGLLLESASHRT